MLVQRWCNVVVVDLIKREVAGESAIDGLIVGEKVDLALVAINMKVLDSGKCM